MARVTFIDIPEGQEEFYYAGLQAGDRWEYPRVRRKSTFFGRVKVEGLTRRSYLPACSVIWQGFTPQQKQDWKDADQSPPPHGWRTFVADQCKRIKYGIGGSATPSVLHNDMVGAIDIDPPASEVKIAQYHPAQYYIRKKRTGVWGVYDLVSITESLTLPFSISLNYKSDLIAINGNPIAKFYAVVRHFYQGQNLDTEIAIDIPLQSGWATATENMTVALGEVAGYTLFIHLKDVTGNLWFDRPKATHGGQNWCRDPWCKNISMSFTRAFYQVPKHWGAITLPPGSAYNSKYPD